MHVISDIDVNYKHAIAEELNIALTTIKNIQPSGVTPLSEHVREIRANVMAMKDDLSQMGQKVVIVLATDGLPSNEHGVSSSHTRMEFQNALIFHSKKGGKNRKSYYHKENVLEASLKRPGKVGGS